MKLVVYPFPSQQDKTTGQFILDTCGTCKMLAWLVDRVQEELGWECVVVLPKSATAHPFKCKVRTVNMLANNRHLRVDWNLHQLRKCFYDADMALLNHETLATPLRALFPKLKIVQQCLIAPEPLELFLSAWKSADMTVVHGEFAKRYVAMYNIDAKSWLMGYDATKTLPLMERDIDVLYATRSSCTNYTHHLEFLQANLSELRVAYADPTKYLQLTHPGTREYVAREAYATALRRTKVAVFLHAGWFSFALREAIAAGCTPVVLDHPCFDELLGAQYPHRTAPANIEETVRKALAEPIRVDATRESFQSAWLTVKTDLETLYGK